MALLRNLEPKEIGGSIFALFGLLLLLLGSNSLLMQGILVFLGLVGFASVLDLPFPRYHLLAPLSLGAVAFAIVSSLQSGLTAGGTAIAILGIAIALVYGRRQEYL